MATLRYEISVRVLKTISRVSVASVEEVRGSSPGFFRPFATA